MATFRDDLAALARAGRERLLEAAADRGWDIVPAGTTQTLAEERNTALQEAESERSATRRAVRKIEMLGQRILTATSSQYDAPDRVRKDLPRMNRIALVREAEKAWREDQNAGQYTDLYLSFVFGRGVPPVKAVDPEVQRVLDETWADPTNKLILTSYPALCAKGVDLCISSNVLLLLHDDGDDGRVRLGHLAYEEVEDPVRHPLFRPRITYYKAREDRAAYDFKEGALRTVQTPAGAPKWVYYQSHVGFDDDDAGMRAQDEEAERLGLPLHPPAAMLRPGRVLHLAVNRHSETGFGVPRMQRMIRWYSAYNRVLDSHVKRMEYAAKMVMKADVEGVTRATDLQQVAFDAIRTADSFARSTEEYDGVAAGGLGVLGQANGVNYDPLKIDTGASDVAASLPQLRASGTGIFPTSYFGEPAGSMAGAQSVELPVLKFIEAEQELWRDAAFRPLAQAAIDAAIKSGHLEEWRDLTADEQAERDAALQEGRDDPYEVNQRGQVKRDLSFDVQFPDVLKRAMNDLVGAAIQVVQAVDASGQNVELLRWLLSFTLSKAFDVENADELVDEILPLHVTQAKLAEQQQLDRQMAEQQLAHGEAQLKAAQAQAAGGGASPREGKTTGPDGRKHPASNPAGAKLGTKPPEKRRVQEAGVLLETIAVTSDINDLAALTDGALASLDTGAQL